MDIQDFEELYGPPAQHSDHRIGEEIRFFDAESGQELEGTIIWVKEPGPNYEGGPDRPLTYVVDAGGLFPLMVYQADIIETF